MIHVCFGLHDADGRYSKFTGTTIASIFENTAAKVTAHILHDNTLTQDNRDKFLRLARQYNQRVKFYNAEKLCADKIKEYATLIPNAKTSQVGIGAFYRLLITKILPENIEKIAYLDSDIIVNLDIAELWRIELGDKILACVPESFNGVDTQERLPLCSEGYVRNEDYFNSGVLLMDLKRFRKEDKRLKEGIKFRSEHLYYPCFDQDILNYCFSTRTLQLTNKFNFIVRDARNRSETKIGQKIYHYASRRLGLESDDIFNRLWLKYFMRSMWCDEDIFGRLYEKFQEQDTQVKNLLISLTSALKDRNRAFISFAEYVEPIKFVFAAQNDELLVIENFKDMPQLINTLKNLRGQKVFLIMIPNYPLLHDLLTAEGFVENKDFFDGTKFLSKAHGWQVISSYKFIREM